MLHGMWLVSFVQNCDKDQAHSPGPWRGPKIARCSFQPFDFTTEEAAAGIVLRTKSARQAGTVLTSEPSCGMARDG